MDRSIIEKQLKRNLSEAEWKKLVNAYWLDVNNWMMYHQRDEKAS